MMNEDMHDYGVYADAMAIDFNEDELDSSDFEQDDSANDSSTHQAKNLIDNKQQQIYTTLLEGSNHGRLKKIVQL
jgi:hypothetical protein